MPDLVVVPPQPGPLLRAADERPGRRDDIDDLIDEVLPATDEGPGWFDAALVAGGAALAAWGGIGGGPDAALVLGPLAAGLGCILPVRSAWRARSARRRAALLRRGLPLDVGEPVVATLVAGYERLLAVAPAGSAAVAAAHGAVSEVASLLRGRPPGSDGERRYVEERAVAIDALAGALARADAGTGERAAVLEAREELERATGTGSLPWLAALTEEASGDRGPGTGR